MRQRLAAALATTVLAQMGMSRSRRELLKAVVLTALATVGSGILVPGAAAEEHGYVLATATVGGTFYPVGVALATLINVKLRAAHQIDMTAISSEGSTENVRLLRENKAQFALLSGLIGYYAWAGQGPFAAASPQTHLRAVAALWQEAEHFVVRRAYVKTGTIADMQGLKGKKVSLGLAGSGTIESNRWLLGQFGIDIDRDMDLMYLGYDQSADALQKGKIEAMSTPAGVPVAAVTRALSALGDEIAILGFTDAQVRTADGGLGLWTRYVIKAGTYLAQDEDIQSIAAPNLLAARADADAAAVYWITRTIFENLPFLQAIHKALAAASLDHALTGLPLPLHPGALRYYKEVGLDIPDRLVTP